MTTITGKSATLKADASKASAYLADMNNFEQLLPADKISDFKSETDHCSFKIQNAATIALELQKNSGTELVYGSKAPTPFRFTLTVKLEEQDGGCIASQVCEADLNPMLKMMVQKPLNKLYDYIAEQLEVQLN